jgi:uncharacterized protein
MAVKQKFSSDVAFTPVVKEIQHRKGSRRAYEHMEAGGSWETRITAELARFIEAQRSVFLATANAEGQPYIQHRGGPPGFLRVIDERTIGFVDFVGNRQYITQGNLAVNPKAQLFLIDYANQARVKIWGEAKVLEATGELAGRLMPEGYKARADQIIVFSVVAWDMNCRRHIPQRLEAADVEAALGERDRRIETLEAEVARLQMALRGGDEIAPDKDAGQGDDEPG